MGTWTLAEFLLAVREEGYIVKRIHEMHLYGHKHFDPERKESAIFSSYVNKFLKLKLEASGYPVGVETDQQRDAYVQSVYDKEGIRLNPEAIARKPSKRSIAKLMLNSHWGKFAQRVNQPQVTFCSTSEQIWKLLLNPAIECEQLLPVSDSVFALKWKYKTAVDLPRSYHNVAVAAHVTSHGRIKLFRLLKAHGTRVVYFDTDSAVYVWRGPQDDPAGMGDSLGELTNEIEAKFGAGAVADRIVCCGSKNYSIRIALPHCREESVMEGDDCDDNDGAMQTEPQYRYITKIRGFTLNYKNAQLLNHEVMRAIVYNTFVDCDNPNAVRETNVEDEDTSSIDRERACCVYTDTFKIARSQRTCDLYSINERKKYQAVYTKRRVLPAPANDRRGCRVRTVPFGYAADHVVDWC